MSNVYQNNISISDIQDIKNSIDKYIDMFCTENNIQDILNIPQSVFSAILIYVRDNYIIPSQILINKDSRILEYKRDITDLVCEYYIFLCKKYNKECSLKGFEYLTNINSRTFYEWDNDRKATVNNIAIIKKLSIERENSLSEMLLSGKNPVGVLGILNHFYGWAGTGNMVEDKEKQSASLADLRGKLTDNSPGAAPMIGADSDKQL